jgi:hypothetical protein
MFDAVKLASNIFDKYHSLLQEANVTILMFSLNEMLSNLTLKHAARTITFA